ncbi:MAG: hypothetical protein HQM13_18235 [SAR324 cluster bacterium]|nr:hypothetical protein [SAR324 cluster bacterium]
MGNAIKFTPKDKKVQVKVLGDQENLALMVNDEGIGISDDQQKKIFKAFEQADDSTTKLFGGTGLG